MCLRWLRVNCIGGCAIILRTRTEQQNCFGGIFGGIFFNTDYKSIL